ncbi:hypothetical protein SLE2022_085440 [Rubroshorea leprosula]
MAKHGLFKQIVGDLSFSDSSLLAKLLDSCVQSKSLLDVRRVHATITKTSFALEIFTKNRLIDSYGNCGSLEDVRRVFDRMPERNIFSWNSILN